MDNIYQHYCCLGEIPDYYVESVSNYSKECSVDFSQNNVLLCIHIQNIVLTPLINTP